VTEGMRARACYAKLSAREEREYFCVHVCMRICVCVCVRELCKAVPEGHVSMFVCMYV
jgi:hypothetical protein